MFYIILINISLFKHHILFIKLVDYLTYTNKAVKISHLINHH